MQLRINQGPPQQIYQDYRALEGNFEKGTAQVLLTGLKEGKNTVEVLAWDTFGNKGTLLFISIGISIDNLPFGVFKIASQIKPSTVEEIALTSTPLSPIDLNSAVNIMGNT
jgi:hypothetical protein